MKQSLVLTALLSALLAACSTTPTTTPAAVETHQPAAASDIKDTPVATAQPAQPAGDVRWPELRDPNNILSKRSVYFDFDKFVVKNEYVPLVEAHAKFLKQTGDAKVLIQGNTDERGSREYNLALGQKRADAVKKSLTLLGVKEDQIESVSLGEEKPKSDAHDEAAWAENRRSDILYTGEF
jgi:peptidoglycan-associated lipoprotein